MLQKCTLEVIHSTVRYKCIFFSIYFTFEGGGGGIRTPCLSGWVSSQKKGPNDPTTGPSKPTNSNGSNGGGRQGGFAVPRGRIRGGGGFEGEGGTSLG